VSLAASFSAAASRGAGTGRGSGRLSEAEVIALAERYFDRPAPGLVKGIGDDAAVVAGQEGLNLWSVDILVEGVHFERAWSRPESLGRKALSVNVSDIAAMGGRARFALLSLALPAATERAWLEAFFGGLSRAGQDYGLSLVGGDTTGSPGPVVISICVWGQAAGSAAVLRSGGRAGDRLYLSRPIGAAGAALALLLAGREPQADLKRELDDPRAEFELGPLLGESGLVTAMIDLSDGLAVDLGRLAQASGLAGVIEAEAAPLWPGLAEAAASLGRDPLELALSGGEDYALLLACPEAEAARLEELIEQRAGRRLLAVGHLEEGRGVFLSRQGRRSPLQAASFDHFTVRTKKL